MRRIFFSCLFLLSATSFLCKGQTKQVDGNSLKKRSKQTVATLLILDSTILNSSQTRAFLYQDSVNFGHPVFLNKLQTKLVINSSTLLCRSDVNQTPYLIYPGEQIKIKQAENASLMFVIDGNQQRTNELNFFRLLVLKYGSIYNFFPVTYYHQKASSLEQVHFFEKEIFKTKNLRIRFLDSFAIQSPISTVFFEIAQNAIKSTAIKDSLLLYWSNRDLLNKQNVYSSLVNEKINTIRHVGYKPFLIYFNACQVIVSMATTKYLEYELKDSIDIVKRVAFINNNFDSLTKDFLLANTLYTAAVYKIPVSKGVVDLFSRECIDNGYKKIIAEKQKKKEVFFYPKGANKLMSLDGRTIKDLQSIIAKAKGKTILLDFWASWCSPCRAEMPFAEKLKKEYANKKIIFLNISTDENIQNWQKANEEEGIGSDNSYLLLNSQTSSFVVQNKIQSIPRYILIGKDGKVISADAPRPSDPELKILINKDLE